MVPLLPGAQYIVVSKGEEVDVNAGAVVKMKRLVPFEVGSLCGRVCVKEVDGFGSQRKGL